MYRVVSEQFDKVSASSAARFVMAILPCAQLSLLAKSSPVEYGKVMEGFSNPMVAFRASHVVDFWTLLAARPCVDGSAHLHIIGMWQSPSVIHRGSCYRRKATNRAGHKIGDRRSMIRPKREGDQG